MPNTAFLKSGLIPFENEIVKEYTDFFFDNAPQEMINEILNRTNKITMEKDPTMYVINSRGKLTVVLNLPVDTNVDVAIDLISVMLYRGFTSLVNFDIIKTYTKKYVYKAVGLE